MTYGYIGSMKAKPGKRDEVMAIMLAGVEGLRSAGCVQYTVGASAVDDVTIWTCEVWGTKEQHDTSLQLPTAKEAIARAMSLIAGDFTRVETDVHGGLGLLPGWPVFDCGVTEEREAEPGPDQEVGEEARPALHVPEPGFRYCGELGQVAFDRVGQGSFQVRLDRLNPVPLSALVKVAGARWSVEECFQAGKNEAGLDQYQVRRYDAWYRHATLAMLAHACLAVTAATAPKGPGSGLIPVTLGEVRRLLAHLTARVPGRAAVRAWSRWRRTHQQRARTSRYKRRQADYNEALLSH